MKWAALAVSFTLLAPALAAEPARDTPQIRSLRGRVGARAVEAQLESTNPETRALALERLGALGTPHALDLLAAAVLPGGAAKTSSERLVAVRALARHARHERPRRALVRVMNTGAGASEDALFEIVRETAALALSASRDARALEALGNAARQQGETAAIAIRALLAHPPRDLGPVLKGRGPLSPMFARALGRLGDQRAFDALRNAARRGSPELRAAAAIALTELGALETVELARHWLRIDAKGPELAAAADILTRTRSPERVEAIARLLSEASTRELGIELANAAPHPELTRPLLEQLGNAGNETNRLRLLMAVANAGDLRSVRALQALAPRVEALHALALCPAAEADAALSQLLRQPNARATATRAAALRVAALGREPPGLQAAISQLFKSSAPDDRAAAAFAQTVLDPVRGAELLRTGDNVAVRAAARAATSESLAGAAVARLRSERDATTRAALAIGLVQWNAAASIPSAELWTLLARVPAARPLITRALAARFPAQDAERLEPVLSDPDALVRAHAALGLGHSGDLGALGVLRRMYRFESDARVRRAIASALGGLPPVATRDRELRRIAELDPDADCRERAEAALRGRVAAEFATGSFTVWTEIASTPGAPATQTALQLTTSDGLVLPGLPDPGGSLLFVRLPSGSAELRLAPAPNPGKAVPP